MLRNQSPFNLGKRHCHQKCHKAQIESRSDLCYQRLCQGKGQKVSFIKVRRYVNRLFQITQNFVRFNIDVGVSANIGPEIGVGPKFGVNYEREGREFVGNEVQETLDLGFHNITKVGTCN